MAHAVVPFGVGFFVRIENVLGVKNFFGLAKQINNFLEKSTIQYTNSLKNQ